MSCSIAEWPKTIDLQKFRNEKMYIGAYRYTIYILMTADAPRSKLWYPAQNSDSPPQFRLSCSIAQWPKSIDM